MTLVCCESRCTRPQTCVNLGLHRAMLTLVFPHARSCLSLSLLSRRSHHRCVSLRTRRPWGLLYLIISALAYPCCTYSRSLTPRWSSTTFFYCSMWIQILCWRYCASHYELFFVSRRISWCVHLIISGVCWSLLLLLLLFLLQISYHLLRYYRWLA